MLRSAPGRRLVLLVAASPLAMAGLPSPVFAQSDPAAAPDAVAAPVPSSAPEGPRWTLAPIRWGGRVGFEYRRTRQAGEPDSSSLVEDLNIGAATYVWQPWFVQVAGSLGLVASQNESGNGTSGGSGDSTGLTGNFSLAVFPTSRFPFLLSYDRTDSRTSGDFFGLDYTSDRWAMRQSYRTLGGGTSATFTADSSTLDSKELGKDRVDSVGAEVSTSWDRQQLTVTSNASENKRDADETGSRLLVLGAQHSYRPDLNLHADSLINYTRNDIRLRLAAADVDRQVTDFRQYSTFASYRPDDEHPLQVIGTLRAFDAKTTQSGTVSNDVLSVSGTTALNYRVSENLSAFGALSASQVETPGSTSDFYSETAGVNYALTPRQVLGSSYTANASASAAYSHGDGTDGQTQAGAQFGHSLTRLLGQSGSSSYLATAGQTVGTVWDGDRGSTHTLIHSLGLSWRYSGAEGGAGYASLSLGDSRTYGATESRFSLANLQISGQFQFSQYASGSANFTAQYNQQSVRAVRDPGGGILLPSAQTSDNTNVSGALTYQHNRALNVPRLRFTSQLNAYNNAYSRAAGDPNAPPQRVSWTFENRVDYFIGRLQARFGLRLAEIDGKENALLFLRVNRNFGS